MTHDFVPDDHVVPYERGSEHFVYTPAEQTWGDLCRDLAQVRVSKVTVAQYASAAKKDRREIKRNAAGGLITLARIASDYRNAKGRRTLDASAVEFFTGFEVDIDQGSPEQRERIRVDAVAGTGPVFSNFEYVVFDSFSSLPGDWRGKLFVPIAEQVGLDEHLEFLRGFAVLLERHYGVPPDPTSIASTHGQYVPARLIDSTCTVTRVRGLFVDVARLREAAKDYAPPTAAKEKAGAKEKTNKPRTQATGIVAEINARWPEVLAALGTEVVESPRRANERAICCPLGDRPYSEPMLDIDDDGDWICRVCPPGTSGHFISLVARIVGGSNAEAITRCCEILGLPGQKLDVDGERLTGDEVERMAAAAKGGTVDQRAAALAAWKQLPAEIRALTLKGVAKSLGLKMADMEGGGGGATEAAVVSPFVDIPGWPDPVDGARLLDDLAEFYSRFVILPPHAAVTMALWTVFAFSLDSFRLSPRLFVGAPEAECGKSKVLNVMGLVLVRLLRAASITGALLPRVIEKYRPFLLLDEVDNYLDAEHADLAAVINSGHEAEGAWSWRCGDKSEGFEPTPFSTWAAYLFAGIVGKMPVTTMSRCIVVMMRRKAAGEKVAIITRKARAEGLDLAARCARFAADNAKRLTDIDEASDDAPWRHSVDGNRKGDNWLPLLAVATAAGGDWLDKALAAMMASGSSAGPADETAGAMLLADLRTLFGHDNFMYSSSILNGLAGEDLAERPWLTWDKGRPITARGVARLLKPYGVFSKDVGPLSKKGYTRESLEGSWAAYVRESSSGNPQDAVLSAETREQHEIGSSTPADSDGVSAGAKADVLRGIRVSADKTGSGGTKGETTLPGLWDAPPKTRVYETTKKAVLS